MKNKVVTATLAAVVAMSVAGMNSNAVAAGKMGDKKGMEKCYGVAKAKMNDCAGSKHACAGQASSDNDADSWVYVPKGSCNKIVGGSLTAATPSTATTTEEKTTTTTTE